MLPLWAAPLGQMVASLTLGKKRYADVQGRIEELIPRFEAVRDELLVLADEDAKAFEPLSRAYGLPKGTEEERAHKAEVMEAALRSACEPPLERSMEKTCEAIDLVDEISRIGTRIAISDAGAGATLLSAALKAVASTSSSTPSRWPIESTLRTSYPIRRRCSMRDARRRMTPMCELRGESVGRAGNEGRTRCKGTHRTACSSG